MRLRLIVHFVSVHCSRQGEIPKIVALPKTQSVPPVADDWSIKTVDRLKYEELFESLHPVDGLLPGNKVRSVLMDSKLPLDALSKIWDLADQDRDGSLDKHEFVVVSCCQVAMCQPCICVRSLRLI